MRNGRIPLTLPRVMTTHPGVLFLAGHARDELSALALDAYPEAYGEFKCAMVAFLWPPGTAGAPRDVISMWDPTQRNRVAETLANTLKLAIGRFSLTSNPLGWHISGL